MEQQYSILMERREICKSKKILKRLYHRWHGMIKNALKLGSILEIGGGSVNLKDFFRMQLVPISYLHHGLMRCWMHTTFPSMMKLSTTSYSLIYCIIWTTRLNSFMRLKKL